MTRPPRSFGSVAGICLMASAAAAHAVPKLELLTADMTLFPEVLIGPGNSASVSYTLQFSGLSTASGAEDLVLGYDVGIAYNPDVARLTGFSFHPDQRLGDPGMFEVIQWDPADNNTFFPPDPVNSSWDWRDNSSVTTPSPTGQTFVGLNGPLYGIPDTVVDFTFHQGSLRFSETSFLGDAELTELQITNNTTPGTFPVAILTFTVDLSQPGATPIDIIFASDYLPPSDCADLGVQLNAGCDQTFVSRTNGGVTVGNVSAPSTLLTMVLGLVLLRLRLH